MAVYSLNTKQKTITKDGREMNDLEIVAELNTLADELCMYRAWCTCERLRHMKDCETA